MSDTPSKDSETIVILTTAGDAGQAGKIAAALVDSRLAACVNIIPRIQSVYRWKEKIEKDEESLLLIKTRRGLFEKTRAAIREAHSYDLPDVIALDVAAGDAEVLNWIRSSTRDD